jgi:hypothetical protein
MGIYKTAARRKSMEKSTGKKQKTRKKKRLALKELEKKVLPSPLASKKPPMPPPYAPGTYYGLASRKNLSRP